MKTIKILTKNMTQKLTCKIIRNTILNTEITVNEKKKMCKHTLLAVVLFSLLKRLHMMIIPLKDIEIFLGMN